MFIEVFLEFIGTWVSLAAFEARPSVDIIFQCWKKNDIYQFQFQ